VLSALASVEDLGKHGNASSFYIDFRLSQLAKIYDTIPGMPLPLGSCICVLAFSTTSCAAHADLARARSVLSPRAQSDPWTDTHRERN
jgi:hypothetical protein